MRTRQVRVKDGSRGTPGRILKVNHAGEFGAINIYRAQIAISRILSKELVPVLREFLAHERTHLETFESELMAREIRRCKSYWFCGAGGFLLGLVTGVLGRNGIMACTAAVETVVTRHLQQQLGVLKQWPDTAAHDAVNSILEDEEAHRDFAIQEGKSSVLYRPIYGMVETSTEFVIWLGMRL